MTEKLKPCPFCGSETAPTVIDLGVDLGTIGSVTIVVCHIPHKGCGAATNWRENSEKAIAKWNHRANEAAIDAAVKAAVLEEREACAMMRMCEWHREATDSNCWSSDCGNAFEINEGTPEENSMTYCCFCGHPIEGIDSND